MIDKTGFRIQDSGCHPQDRKGLPLEQEALKCLLLNEGVGQRGFSLISAIFLLVVIAALGTFAVTLSTTQHQSQAMDVMGSRAYQAALAGVEWAAFNVALSPASAPAAWAGCTAGATVAVAGNLAAFSPVTVNCSATSAVEGVSTLWVYDVSAVAATTGSAPGNANYVEQVATAKLAR